VFTDSPLTMLEAEKTHRAHAVVEQVIADFRGGALAHVPSGSFAANGGWLVMAAIAFNLTLRRRDRRVGLSRQSHHRHDPPAADRGPGPHRQFRAATGHPP
jgi:hypothetical protein